MRKICLTVFLGLLLTACSNSEKAFNNTAIVHIKQQNLEIKTLTQCKRIDSLLSNTEENLTYYNKLNNSLLTQNILGGISNILSGFKGSHPIEDRYEIQALITVLNERKQILLEQKNICK